MLTEMLIISAPFLVAAAAAAMGYEIGTLGENPERSLSERENN